MLRRALLRRRPTSAAASSCVAEQTLNNAPATAAAAAPLSSLGRRGRAWGASGLARGYSCSQYRAISSTTAALGAAGTGGSGSTSSPSPSSSVVAPASWSIHDLKLLREDAGAGGARQEELSQEELLRLAGYAHVEVGPGSKLEEGKLQEDLGAIIRCMALLQKAKSLEGVSREEMYAPPPHAAPATPLRDDVVTEGGPEQQRQLLALSGETARQQFVVPTVVDKA